MPLQKSSKQSKNQKDCHLVSHIVITEGIKTDFSDTNTPYSGEKESTHNYKLIM